MKLVGSKIVTALGLAILALAAAGFGMLQGARTAHAGPSQVYTVDKNTAAGGVYARFGPHTNATMRINGFGVYPGQTVMLLCGVTDGDPVGPYQNKTWHFVADLSNPGESNFWLNDHYVDSPNVANQLAPGESKCANESTNPLAPNIPNPEYNRTAAVNWALAHAKDPQTNGEECAKFVSEALWSGGLPQTPGTSGWNNQNGYWSRGTWFPGTVTANAAQPLLDYLEQHFSTQWISLGRMNAGNNNIPQAQIGDIIAYSWKGNGTIDHLAFIVGFAEKNSEYPLVAEWGQFNWIFVVNNIINPSSRYQYRGWTWSAIHKIFLQQEKGNQNMTAYLLHFNGGYVGPGF
jgi:hypothetical protein